MSATLAQAARIRSQCGSLPALPIKSANALRIAILVDPAAPVVSYHTWFRVGSRFLSSNCIVKKWKRM